MPLGRADKVLGALGGTGGSVGNLYASVEGLDPAHVHPSAAARETLLQPTVLSPPAASAELSFNQQRKLYTCSTGIYSFHFGRNVTDGQGKKCPSCGDPMTKESWYVPPGPAAGDAGFVRGGDAASRRPYSRKFSFAGEQQEASTSRKCGQLSMLHRSRLLHPPVLFTVTAEQQPPPNASSASNDDVKDGSVTALPTPQLPLQNGTGSQPASLASQIPLLNLILTILIMMLSVIGLAVMFAILVKLYSG